MGFANRILGFHYFWVDFCMVNFCYSRWEQHRHQRAFRPTLKNQGIYFRFSRLKPNVLVDMSVNKVNSATKLGSQRILVVEDEMMLRLLVESILNNSGYQVNSAASGEEALNLWRAQNGNFDVLLTDMMLPDGLSGSQIAQQFRAERAGLKVIYSSGFASELLDNASEQLVEGVNFLQKPYTTENLAETVRQCLLQ